MLKFTTPYPIRVSFRRLMMLALVGNAVSFWPAIFLFWLVFSPPPLALASIFAPFLGAGVIFAPVLAWLIAKGSNWSNTRFALFILMAFPLRFYSGMSAIAIGVVVYRMLSSMRVVTDTISVGTALVVVVMLFWSASRFLVMPLARSILARWAPDHMGSFPPTTA